MKYKNEGAGFGSILYSKHVNKLVPSLVQSKSFSVGVTSQTPETNANLAIRPKKIISSILVSIPVIHEKKLYVNFAPTSPSQSEHSDTQLRYIGCSPKVLI
jgi:hypothetical protein